LFSDRQRFVLSIFITDVRCRRPEVLPLRLIWLRFSRGNSYTLAHPNTVLLPNAESSSYGTNAYTGTLIGSYFDASLLNSSLDYRLAVTTVMFLRLIALRAVVRRFRDTYRDYTLPPFPRDSALSSLRPGWRPR